MALRKYLILRRPRSGRLEGRTKLIQAIADFSTASKAGAQVMFMDRDDILNLFVVTNLPLPSGALSETDPFDDELPF
jgi:hypothetical protein